MKIRSFLLTALCLICTSPVFANFTDGDFTFSENGSNCTLIKYSGAGGDVTIPSVATNAEGGFTYTVTVIGDDAFQLCYSLTFVIIPDGVLEIGKGAFSYCDNLAEVTIPKSVTVIGDQAFSSCDMLTEIKVADGNMSWASEDGVLYNKSKSLLHTCLQGKSGSFIIPSSVTEIASSAFRSCRNLSSITIPNSVTEIGHSAFAYCSSLAEITIGNSVTTIGRSAFYGCESLTSITIPNSVKVIGVGVFANCSMLTEINVADGNISWVSEDGVLYNKDRSLLHTCPSGKSGSFIIPSSVTEIEGYAFYSCSDLSSITIPNSVTAIDSFAFWDCHSLTSAVIPNSVTTIGDYAFSNCSSLTPVIIPNSVTTIGRGAFVGCISLTSVVIPNSVTDIGWNAFWHCSSLRDVTVFWATPLVIYEWNQFRDVDLPNCTLHVPSGTKTLYAAADAWKDFGTILETAAGGDDDDNDEGVESVNSNKAEVTLADRILTITSASAEQIEVYSLTGALLYKASKAAGTATINISHLPKGVLIVRGNTGWTQKIVLK
jgi:Flp pilus assembly protein protease CpaA